MVTRKVLERFSWRARSAYRDVRVGTWLAACLAVKREAFRGVNCVGRVGTCSAASGRERAC